LACFDRFGVRNAALVPLVMIFPIFNQAMWIALAGSTDRYRLAERPDAEQIGVDKFLLQGLANTWAQARAALMMVRTPPSRTPPSPPT